MPSLSWPNFRFRLYLGAKTAGDADMPSYGMCAEAKYTPPASRT